MNTLFELLVSIGIDKSGFDKGINDAKSKFSKLSTSLKNSQEEAKKIGTNAISSAAKGVEALENESKDGIKEYDKFAKSIEKSSDEASKSVQEDAEKAYKSAGDATDKYVTETESKFSKVGNAIKTGLATAAKVGAAAVGAAATGVVALTKSSLDSYAEYEQLVGGVDTLFGKASQAVQDKAAEAYKAAGMSANEYMQTVTSFSASLIQSLGGDTEKAAKYADMAITDMSDNANKMGTSMEMIQNAYNGLKYRSAGWKHSVKNIP